MLRNKTALKIFSLLAAIFLWLYVMGEIDPEMRQTVRDIPVSYVGTDILEEKGLAVVQKEEIFVTAVIEGKRSDVNKVKDAGLTAYVDVSECDKGKNTVKINITLPGTVSLESLSDSTLKVKVEKLAKAEKPVEIEFTDAVEGSDKMARVLEYEMETIAVKGASGSVDSIETFKGEISSNDASEEESKWLKVSLTPVTKSGDEVPGVEAERKKIKVRIQMLSIKTVNLKVVTENVEKGISVEKVEAPSRLQLLGPVYTVEKLEEVTGTVDIKGITEDTTKDIILSLPKDTFILEKNNSPVAEITVRKTE